MPFLDLLRTPDTDASAPALLWEQTTYSRGEVVDAVTALAERLGRAGIGPRTKVLAALPNSPAFLFSLLAVNQCGGVFLPLSPGLTADERQRIDAIARPDFLLGEQGAFELLPGAALTPASGPRWDDDADLEGIAAIIFTSGTTGSPKGVMMTEAALRANARAVATNLALSDADRTLLFLPLHYTYALSQVLSTWMAGGSILLLRNLFFPQLAFDAIAHGGVTGFGGVPASLTILTDHAERASGDRGALRYVLSAGGPLRQALAARVQQAFPGVAVVNNYGCTEIGPRATMVDYGVHPGKMGSIGCAIPGVEVCVVRPDDTLADPGEVGEIALRGPSLMRGYYRAPEATAARMSARGFHTGDYASADADGFLFYEGRRDDIFKSAGEKISAQEIEEVVLQHVAVAEAAVVPIADPRVGAVPVAYIVLRPGASCTERELQTFCGGRLSLRKVPRAVHFVDALGKTASGKVQKYRLRELAS